MFKPTAVGIQKDIEPKRSDIPRRFDRIRVRILFDQGIATQTGSVLAAIYFLFIFHNKLSSPFLTLWGGAFVALVVARFIFIRIFFKKDQLNRSGFNATHWEIYFSILSVAGSALWAVAMCSPITQDGSGEIVMSFLFAGLTTGAALAYASSLIATYCFFLPMIIPFAIKLVLLHDEMHFAMAGMLVIYCATYIRYTAKLHKSVIKSISLSFQKEELIEKIRLMQSQVTQAAKMGALSEMAGGMAHEINNPLAAIVGAVGSIRLLMEHKKIEDAMTEIQSFLEMIERGSERISKIVLQLRSFAGRPGDEHFISVPLKNLIETAFGFCSERFRSQGVRLTAGDIDKDLYIECRPYHMTQVLLNLLNNSYDAIVSKREKWIKVECTDFGDKIEISVTDSGDGVPEQFRSKIMQPFFSTKDVGRGVGLGLSVSKGIIESHNGEIWLDTGCPNTRFVVTIPKKAETIGDIAA